MSAAGRSWITHGRLARYKCPRHIVFAEIPKTSTGKVQKYALRERARLLASQSA